MPGYDFQGVRFPFCEIVHGVGVTGAVVDAVLAPVPSGHLRIYTHLVVVDEDNNNTTIHVYIGGFGQLFLVEEDLSPVKAEPYVITDDVFVPENRWLLFRFTGSTTSDDLYIYAQGYDLVQPEGAKHA